MHFTVYVKDVSCRCPRVSQSLGMPVCLKTAGGGSWTKGGSGESTPGRAALLPRRPPGPIPGELEAAGLPGPRPRADSARRLRDPGRAPPASSIPVRPHRPPPAPLTPRVSAAHSPRLRGLLAPQATSGFARHGRGARDQLRGAPARAYSAAAEFSGPQSPVRTGGARGECGAAGVRQGGDARGHRWTGGWPPIASAERMERVYVLTSLGCCVKQVSIHDIGALKSLSVSVFENGNTGDFKH